MSSTKRFLRVRVNSGEKMKVNLAVPLGLARLARYGGIAHQIARKQGVDFEQILAGIEESPDGTLIDVVDEKNGDHVEMLLETRGSAAAESPEASASAIAAK